MTPMKKTLIRELVGTAGYCQLVYGLYAWFGHGVAFTVGGALLVVAALLMKVRA